MDAGPPRADPRLLFSRPALRHNVRALRRGFRQAVRISPIVKADAYGLGATTIVDALTNFIDEDHHQIGRTIDELAVATIDEAAALGQVGLPVLILRPVENAFVGRERSRLELAIRAGWSLT